MVVVVVVRSRVLVPVEGRLGGAVEDRRERLHGRVLAVVLLGAFQERQPDVDEYACAAGAV